MSIQNYITDLLELKDNNVFFKKNCYYKENIKGVTYKIFEGYLSYKPKFCPKCGVLFDDKFEKHGFIISNIKNTFTTNYHNGYIEENNILIKVIKRIVFGFRSFRRFKARIMICKGLIKIKKPMHNCIDYINNYHLFVSTHTL